MFANEAFLFDASWIFFAVWTLVLFAASLIAFSGELPVLNAVKRGTRPNSR